MSYLSANIDSEFILFIHNCPCRNHERCIYHICNTNVQLARQLGQWATALPLGKHSCCPRVPVVPARGTPPDPCPATPWHSARSPPLPSRAPARPPPLPPVPARMNPALALPWGGTPPEFRNPNNNAIIVSILPRGAEFGMGGVQAIPPDAEFFNKKSMD